MKRLYTLLVFILTFTLTKPVQSQDSLVTFYTSMGNFDLEMYDSLAPLTVGNFESLAQSKFYDNVIFHRVIDGFMIQGGDPTGTGSGGPGYTIPDEFHPDLSNVQKSISMANIGQPNTGGSQFFINLVNNTYLDFNQAPLTSQHAVFGIVINNFSVVQDIGQVATNGANRPLVDVVIDSIRVRSIIPASDHAVEQVSVASEVYPNPIQPNSIVTYYASTSKELEIRLYNQMGSLISNSKREALTGSNSFVLAELSNQLASGIYFLTLSTDDKSIQHKIIVP